MFGLLKPPVAGDSSGEVTSRMSKKVVLASAIAKLLEIELNRRSNYTLKTAKALLSLFDEKNSRPLPGGSGGGRALLCEALVSARICAHFCVPASGSEATKICVFHWK